MDVCEKTAGPATHGRALDRFLLELFTGRRDNLSLDWENF
jgi:hypothetical protein